jgi:hypothetical protein
MDERLQKALDHSNYMVTLNNQKRLLREQYKENLVYYYNGGQFKVTQELISFCQSLVTLEQDGTILIDDNSIPIEVDNVANFSAELYTKYFEATNQYFVEYNKLKKNRTVESIINL